MKNFKSKISYPQHKNHPYEWLVEIIIKRLDFVSGSDKLSVHLVFWNSGWKYLAKYRKMLYNILVSNLFGIRVFKTYNSLRLKLF
jgi:hypothetical protein